MSNNQFLYFENLDFYCMGKDINIILNKMKKKCESIKKMEFYLLYLKKKIINKIMDLTKNLHLIYHMAGIKGEKIISPS